MRPPRCLLLLSCYGVSCVDASMRPDDTYIGTYRPDSEDDRSLHEPPQPKIRGRRLEDQNSSNLSNVSNTTNIEATTLFSFIGNIQLPNDPCDSFCFVQSKQTLSKLFQLDAFKGDELFMSTTSSEGSATMNYIIKVASEARSSLVEAELNNKINIQNVLFYAPRSDGGLGLNDSSSQVIMSTFSKTENKACAEGFVLDTDAFQCVLVPVCDNSIDTGHQACTVSMVMLLLGTALFLAGVAYSFTDAFEDEEMNLRKFCCDFSHCDSWTKMTACCWGYLTCQVLSKCRFGCPKIPDSYKSCACCKMPSCCPEGGICKGCGSCMPKSCCPEGGICKGCGSCMPKSCCPEGGICKGCGSCMPKCSMPKCSMPKCSMPKCSMPKCCALPSLPKCTGCKSCISSCKLPSCTKCIDKCMGKK